MSEESKELSLQLSLDQPEEGGDRDPKGSREIEPLEKAFMRSLIGFLGILGSVVSVVTMLIVDASSSRPSPGTWNVDLGDVLFAFIVSVLAFIVFIGSLICSLASLATLITADVKTPADRSNFRLAMLCYFLTALVIFAACLFCSNWQMIVEFFR